MSRDRRVEKRVSVECEKERRDCLCIGKRATSKIGVRVNVEVCDSELFVASRRVKGRKVRHTNKIP